MTGAGLCGHPSRRAKGAHLRMTAECVARKKRSIPCDDLALALMDVRRIEQIVAAPPHQELRPPRPARAVTPAPRARRSNFLLRQLGEREDVAPHLPGGRDLVAVGTDAQGNRQGRIAM